MKRKVLVASTIETDETGKYCAFSCNHFSIFWCCKLFGKKLKQTNENFTQHKRCAKCIKAELVKPK